MLERTVVDPDLVDAAEEAVAAGAAGADPQRPAGREELPGGGGPCDLDATHEQAHGAAVVDRGQVGPTTGFSGEAARATWVVDPELTTAWGRPPVVLRA